jgi:hypothetical protein
MEVLRYYLLILLLSVNILLGRNIAVVIRFSCGRDGEIGI